MKILLIAYDNNSYIHFFPLGLAYIASVLRKEGHDVTVYNQDVNHYSEEHLSSFISKNDFDVVGLGFVAGYYQYKKISKISKAITKIKDHPFYIMGGQGPSPEPEFFLKKMKADAVTIGEGEATIVNLVRALEKGSSLSKIKGIAYRKNNSVQINERQPLIKDIDTIPFPSWDLFPIDYYSLFRYEHMTNSDRTMPIVTSRGCPFKCNFCYRMDEGIRLRKPECIVEEMSMLKEKYNITHIDFIDELLMVSKKRTKEVCRAIIDSGLDMIWRCSGRLNFAEPEVLKLMKKAGCVFINYGIECMDDSILKVMHKNLTVKQIKSGITATLKEEISPGFNIIFGNIGENAQTLQKGVDFLVKNDDHTQLRTIRPVTPYPGSELYYYAIEKGLMKDVEDFYENKHLNSDMMAVNFTELSDKDYYKNLYKANVTLLKSYYEEKLKQNSDMFKKMYFEKDTSFRGFR